MYLYAKGRGKKVNICVDGDMKSRSGQIYAKYKIPFESKLKPLKYSVIIDHSEGGLDSVKYEDKEGKFSLYITPTKIGNGFNFKDVEFKEGGRYDLVIVIGAEKLSSLGSIYSENIEFFGETNIINVNNLSSEGFGRLDLVETGIPVSEIVFNLLKEESSSISVDLIMKLLLMGILNELQLFNKSDYKTSTLETIASLVKLGADLKDSFEEVYLSMSSKMINVIREVFNHISEDEKYSIAWSMVDNLNFRKYNVKKKNLVLDGRIPFNITSKYDISFVLYEVKEGEIWVELESNNKFVGAVDILSQFSPSGHNYRALAVVKNMSMNNVRDIVLALAKGFIDNKAESTAKSDSKNILTSRQELGHNSSASEKEGLIAPPPLTPSM
jgi:nanoRNase/pAp phosphatase (c-di-AMP/oligoRNAs hydrolase)